MSVCTTARNNACAHYGHRAAVGAPFPVRQPCTRKKENVMVKFILKRIGTMIIAMFMIILITFTLMHSIPGGPFTNTKGVPEEVTQAMEAKYGLDQPMPVQFVKYLGSLLHGDFGPSYKYTGKTVNDFIATGAPVSAKLGLVTLVFVLLTAIPMGILAALKNGKWQDMLLMAIATIGVTIPSFVIASMLIYVFSFKLNVLPTFGLDSWKSYILPVIAMGGYSVSYLARLMRSSLLDVMGQDYMRTARAKGVSQFMILFKHALRNAILPVITYVGPMLASLMTGSFVVEKIFSVPGLGRDFVSAITNRDYTMIMGTTILLSSMVIIANVIVDILYKIIDPRIKLQ